MTVEQLYEEIQALEEKIDRLETNFNKLKEWSDLNDYWLQETINTLTESVDKNTDLIHKYHGK